MYFILYIYIQLSHFILIVQQLNTAYKTLSTNQRAYDMNGASVNGNEQTLDDLLSQIYQEFMNGHFESLLCIVEQMHSLNPDIRINPDSARYKLNYVIYLNLINFICLIIHYCNIIITTIFNHFISISFYYSLFYPLEMFLLLYGNSVSILLNAGIVQSLTLFKSTKSINNLLVYLILTLLEELNYHVHYQKECLLYH